MGACGCGERPFERGYRVKGTKAIVAYQVFRGCEDCDYGPGVSISFFDRKGIWLEGAPIETVTPDEYGSHQGYGVGVGLFDMRDLEAAAKELTTEADIGPGDDQYASLEDWLHDYGQRLITEAMILYSKRRAAARGQEEAK